MAKGLFRLLLPLVAALAACARDPVAWNAAVTTAGTALPGRLVLVGDTPRFATDTAALVAPLVPGSCAGSARVALSGTSGTERYVAWWAPRPDSSATLVAARSTDGGRSWSAPEPV